MTRTVASKEKRKWGKLQRAWRYDATRINERDTYLENTDDALGWKILEQEHGNTHHISEIFMEFTRNAMIRRETDPNIRYT